MGATLTLDDGSPALGPVALLFGEAPSRIVISFRNADRAAVEKAVAGAPFALIGRTGGDTIRIAVGGEKAVALAVADAERAWSNAVEQYFAKRVA